MDTLRLGLEWFLNPDHVPLLIAREKGWFAEGDLQVELVEPEEHLDAVREIEEDRMDIAITEPIHLVQDRAKGKQIIGFARFLHTNGGVMYFRDRGIARPRDMVGKRIQYPGAPGPGGPATVTTMIEADGGQSDPTQFGLVNNGFYHTDALADGMADVATLVFYNFEVIEARKRGFDAAFFSLKDWGVPDFCQLVLIAAPRTLQTRREPLQRLVRILRRGVDFLHECPTEAKEIYDRQAQADPSDETMQEIFAATLRCFTYDFSMSLDYYRKLQEWMLARRLIEASSEPHVYWTNELIL